jgi:hypothetical protein
MSDPLAVEGRRPQDDWLLGPLLGAQLESTRDGVRITFRQPVPDLPERLAHPRLALQDTVIASRFASHRFAGPRRLDLLLPRHPGAVPLQLIPTRDPVEARARFVRGQDALLRPFDLALDDSMARAGVAAAAAGHRTVAETPFGIAVLERPTCMAVILDPAAQAPLRRDLARRLRRFTPRDLLAVEDSTLRPLPPAGVVGMEALMADGANAPLAPGALRGVVLEMSVDALPEAHRAADRIAVLLQAEGVQTTLVDRVALGSVPLPTGQTPSSGGNADRRVRARLTRVPLFAHDPLLRALELRARVLPGLDLPEDLRLAAQLDPAASDRRRSETAAQIELELLAEGLVVPLWTQPGLVLCDRRLGDAGAADVDQPQVTSLPLLLQAARWYDDPAPR